MRTTILLLGLLVAFNAPGGDAGDIEALRATLREANSTNDGEVLVRTARRLRLAHPGHPTYSYLLARGEALRHRPVEALQALTELTARGVDMVRHVVDDPAFDAMRALDGYADLVRQADALRSPIGKAERAWQFGAPDTLPEAVAMDARGRVFIGSVRKREIIVRNADGTLDHWHHPALWSVQGLHLSPDGQLLWAATSAMNVTSGIDAAEHGRSALLALDVATGELRAHHPFPADGEHVLGDFIFIDDNTLLATDSIGGGVHALDVSSGKYMTRIAPGVLRSPQGLARIDDAVYIADYSLGLYRLDLATGELSRVADGAATPYGIDGLYAHEGALIAVQNGVAPQQVARFVLSADGTRIVARETLLANHADFEEPTLGVVRNDRFHVVANSHWNHVTRDGDLPADGLVPPVVLSIPLSQTP